MGSISDVLEVLSSKLDVCFEYFKRIIFPKRKKPTQKECIQDVEITVLLAQEYNE